MEIIAKLLSPKNWILALDDLLESLSEYSSGRLVIYAKFQIEL